MFDCCRLQICGGDVGRRFRRLMPLIGHVQIAAVPDRGAPDHGELHDPHVMRAVADAGWTRPIGAEYRPDRATDEALGWLPALHAIPRRTG